MEGSKKMIYITGDIHGNWKSRLHHDVFPEGDTLSKNDYVIICGDFGLWHDTEDERFALNWLNAQPFRIKSGNPRPFNDRDESAACFYHTINLPKA